MKFVRREHLEYFGKRDQARVYPGQRCFNINYGANKFSFRLPHFINRTQDERGNALKVKLISIFDYHCNNILHLFTMMEQRESVPSHIAEALLSLFNNEAATSAFPSKLYILLDNRSRECKNKYLFPYVRCLIPWRVFVEVEASFPPVQRTHE